MERTPIESRFATHDEQELFYRRWPAASGVPRGAVLLFHRGHEHSGRVAHLVDEAALTRFLQTTVAGPQVSDSQGADDAD